MNNNKTKMDDTLYKNPEVRERVDYYKKQLGKLKSPMFISYKGLSFEPLSIIEYVINKAGYVVSATREFKQDKKKNLTTFLLEIKKGEKQNEKM